MAETVELSKHDRKSDGGTPPAATELGTAHPVDARPPLLNVAGAAAHLSWARAFVRRLVLEKRVCY